MKSKDLIKYVAAAIAAFFGYRWAVENGYIADSLGLLGGQTVAGLLPQAQPQAQLQPPQAQPQPPVGAPKPPPQPNGATAPSNGGTSSGPGANVPPGGTGGNGGDIGESVATAVRAARAAMGGGATLAMNFWNWNFYLPANVAKLDPFAIPDATWQSATGVPKPATTEAMQALKMTSEQWYHLSKGAWGLGAINHWGQRTSQRPGAGWVN